MTLVLTGKKCAVLPQGTYTDSSVKGLRYVVKAKQKYFIYRRTIENKPYSVYIGLIPLACKIHPFSRRRTNFPREPLLKRSRGIKNADLCQSID